MAGLAAGALALLAGGCQPAAADADADAPASLAVAGPPVTETEVEALVGRCVQAMVQDVCGVTRDTGSPAATPAPASTQVFVAGTGVIDARAYDEIRAAGEAMCGTVRTRCGEGWDTSACRTARSLWPLSGQPG